MVTSTVEIPRSLDRGRYRIEKVLGQGGTACVLLAFDNRIGVYRAIKLLFPQYAQATGARARLKNEARAQASLQHPNVLMVHDVVEDSDGVYLVMELCDGGSLAHRVESEGPLPVREAVEAVMVVARALQTAHRAGVIHRDIKPGNVLVDRAGTLKLADFGIARVLARDARITEAGTIMGTWAFMPPEQRDASQEADPRSDIYALGVTLYYLLTRQSPANLHNRECHAEAFEGMDPGVTAIIARATRMRPQDRYQSCAELEADLARFLDPHWVPPSGTDAPSRPVVPSVPLQGGTIVPGATTAPETIVLAPRVEPPQASWLVWAGVAFVGLLGLGALGAALGLVADRFLGAGPPVAVVEGADPVQATGALASGPTPAPAGTAPAGAPGPTPEPAGTAPGPTAPPNDSAAPSGAPPGSAATAAPPASEGRRSGSSTKAGAEGAAAASSGGGAEEGPRVIQVIDTTPASPGGTTAPPSEAPVKVATGVVVVRTVPSGGSVWEGSRRLDTRNGSVELPVGSHMLRLTSPLGESTTVPVYVSEGSSTTVCYDFDTNGRCAE